MNILIVDDEEMIRESPKAFLKANARWPGLKSLIFTGPADNDLSPELCRSGLSEKHVFQKPRVELKVLFEAALGCAALTDSSR